MEQSAARRIRAQRIKVRWWHRLMCWALGHKKIYASDDVSITWCNRCDTLHRDEKLARALLEHLDEIEEAKIEVDP